MAAGRSDDPNQLTARALRGADCALFLDFDGTLVDIAERPEAVRVEPGLGATLAQLGERLGGALALVSGRAIAVLDAFLTPHRFDAAGLHGIERRVRGRLFPCRPEDHPALRAGVAGLADDLRGLTGVLIEDKGCSVAVHWRLAPDHADEAEQVVRGLAARLGPGYRLQFGKAVAEILPAQSGKGAAILGLLGEAPYAGRRPIFIGDDLTDEHGFAAVNAQGGVSVRIGSGPTEARFRLASPADLRDRLTAWAATGMIDLPDPSGREAGPAKESDSP
jgi:trehalose 6-phosphate phosphatase